jgi:hypothetical protein
MFLLCCFFSSVVMFVHVSSENLSSFGNSSVRIRCSSDSERPRSASLIRTWCSRDSERVSSEEIKQLCCITRTRVIGAGQGEIGVYGRKQPRAQTASPPRPRIYSENQRLLLYLANYRPDSAWSTENQLLHFRGMRLCSSDSRLFSVTTCSHPPALK